MHFPLLQISPGALFPKKFHTPQKIFQISIFPPKNFWFSSAKISEDRFLVIDSIFYISPCFGKIIISPLLSQISPTYFVKFASYVFFVSPLVLPWCIYASHNARTGRPCPCRCLCLPLVTALSSGSVTVGALKVCCSLVAWYVGLLVPIHIIFCGTNHTRWITIYSLYLGIIHRKRLQNILE